MWRNHVSHDRCYCVSARVHVVMYYISALCMVTMYLLYSASGTDRYLDITFGLQVVERSSFVSVLFREAFSHPYITFFHLPVNGFVLLVSVLFLRTLYLPYIGGRYRWVGKK